MTFVRGSKFDVGQVFDTINWGQVEVIERLENSKLLVVRFINTGNIKTVETGQLSSGSVRDGDEAERLKRVRKENMTEAEKEEELIRKRRYNNKSFRKRRTEKILSAISDEILNGEDVYHPRLRTFYRVVEFNVEENHCTVECEGVVEQVPLTSVMSSRFNIKLPKKENKLKLLLGSDEDNKKAFSIFKGMMARCYNDNSKNYADYGGRGVVIDGDWRNSFEKFCNWYVPKYKKIKDKWDRIDIDKDIKGDGLMYSSESCLVIPSQLNGSVTGLDRITKGLPVGVETHKQSYKVRWREYDVVNKQSVRQCSYFKDKWEAIVFYREMRLKSLVEMTEGFYSIGAVDEEVVELIRDFKLPDHYYNSEMWTA